MIIDGSRKVGILGGSFNPAHEGHIHISLEAKKRLQLDAIWWLVSPGNPLKSQSGTPSVTERLHQAKELTKNHPFIEVSTLESTFKTRYSFDTIKRLKTSFPRTEFTWLIGADNLECFDQWRQWKEIMCDIPIAVFDRNPFSYPSTRSKAAIYSQKNRLPNTQCGALNEFTTPCWTFLFTRPHPQSSTRIRNEEALTSVGV